MGYIESEKRAEIEVKRGRLNEVNVQREFKESERNCGELEG